jgi:nicotinate phosphoribosyltransferase
MPIIQSLLDNDLYKISMQRGILRYKQGVPVRYVFNNRRPEGKFNYAFLQAFKEELKSMSELTVSSEQIDYLAKHCPFLGFDYFEYLRNYRFDPTEVSADLENNELKLEINGTWERTILWEVPLMALISELYFIHCDTDWDNSNNYLLQQVHKIQNKARKLQDITFADFGTRRRRNYKIQDLVVKLFQNLCPKFMGTSNVHLAHIHNVRPIGTMAHEWIMAISVLEGLLHANKHAMEIWAKIYHGELGTVLPDTFGTDAFWSDFDGFFARLFDSLRHDSGDPYKFTDKTIKKYNSLRINPMTKSIIFSDGLDVDSVIAINEYCRNKINCSFGIGTNLTNDFDNSRSLNMVIKLAECNGVPVVKLSDTLGKAIGNKDALRVARWTFFKTPLDSI